MLGYPVTDLFFTAVQALPRVFLFGVPVVVLLLSLAAAADLALPRADRAALHS